MSYKLPDFWDYLEETEQLIEKIKKLYNKLKIDKDELKWFTGTENQERIENRIAEELSDSRKYLCYLQRDYRSAAELFCREHNLDFKKMIMEEAETLDIKAGYTEDNFVYIKCPGLLPNRRSSFSHGGNLDNCFFDSLNAVLEKLNPTYEKFKEVYVIVLVQIYTKNTSVNYLKDNDNLESKHLINIVQQHFLFSDTPLCCDLFYTFREDEKSATEIYLIPQSKFSDWFSKWFTDKKPPEKLFENRI